MKYLPNLPISPGKKMAPYNGAAQTEAEEQQKGYLRPILNLTEKVWVFPGKGEKLTPNLPNSEHMRFTGEK